MPCPRCIEEDEAKYILEEVHKGICEELTGPRSIEIKIIRASYFWPTMQKDAREFIKRCDKCYRFRNAQYVVGEKMMAITSLWPFAQWGIDIMGPLPQGKK